VKKWQVHPVCPTAQDAPAMVRQGTSLQQEMDGPPSGSSAVHSCPKSAHPPPPLVLELAEPVEVVELELAEPVEPELPEPVEPELVVPELVVPELLLALPSGPASEGGTQGPHTPEALPVASRQVSPGQQSALTVHLPQFGTQLPPPGRQM
jgi:hypothetical protein